MNAATTLTIGNWTGYLGMGLAERELQCVIGIAMGQTSKELARDLGIEAETVKKRVLSASTKLGVLRRAQLVAVAISRGFITLALSSTPDPQHDHNQDKHQSVFIA
ncbi:helix-turn-helix transcriptional regulator [Pseudomonas corrugata]|uniref:response regulator transcription factor n=1 Tax=Pseudomonas corrugata TaxID=47879 RepID=UPI00083D0A41|nr:helix-turn-helix transcriptional regulator [Pseudomonas corrugata]AOE63763.1 hypothetical protein AXG94_19035 [Pseudomonas corrugata]